MELYAEKLLQASRITKGTRKTDFCFCNGERATDRSAMDEAGVGGRTGVAVEDEAVQAQLGVEASSSSRRG